MMYTKRLVYIGFISLGAWVFGGCGKGDVEIKETSQIEQSKEEQKIEEIIVAQEVDKVLELLESMTLDEKIGQMLLARCPDVGAIEMIEKYHLGGYILFKRDFENKTKEEVQLTLESYQQAAAIPMMIAVDEEGGTVVRISSNPNLAPSKYVSPQVLDQQGGLQAIEADAIAKAKLLKELGITMNLAPVADISQNPNDYIYKRTIGKDAQGTADYVTTVVKATQKEGIDATLKHFPGYGGNVDTHTGIATDSRPYETFLKKDYIPFKAGIEAGVSSILVSHNRVEAIDIQYPASLSPKVHKELRETLGFEGIIMTDDLEMEAIKAFTHEVHPTVQAVLAGNDLLVVTNIEESFMAIKKAVEESIIKEDIIDEAVYRILKWKNVTKS